MEIEVKYLGIKRLAYLDKTENYLENYGVSESTKKIHIMNIDDDGGVLDELSFNMNKLADLNREREALIREIRESLKYTN